jgi:hypothetical protein
MSKKEKKSESDGMIWANIIVPDPVKGGKSRKNLAFRCQVAGRSKIRPAASNA